MTIKELQPSVDELNKQYKGKIMPPANLPILEFVIAPYSREKLTGYYKTYQIYSGDKKRAMINLQKEAQNIYVVFDDGKLPNSPLNNYNFISLAQFLKANGIEFDLIGI